jgi:hypothetical protein
MKVFPICLFSPDGVDADIDRRTVSGGTALSGEEDLIATDGGGRVFVEFSNFYLDDPQVALAYRALSAGSDGGATPFVVPFCDSKHQPTIGTITVPHSDDTPFSDDSEYEQFDASAVVASDAALRATAMTLTEIELARDLVGGEWFTIVHPVHGDRAYRLIEVDGPAIKFRPPLREAVTAGTAVDFANPRCVMRLDGEMRSPVTLGFADGPGARFVEHFPGPGGY